MVMNLNEHEQLDQTIRQNPDLLAGIIGSAMDAIIAVDDAQRIVLFNAAAEKMFCCPADEAMGNSVERFIPQRFRAEHSTRVRHFDKSGVTNRTLGGLGTLWGLRATGEEFPIEASISKVESAGQKIFTAVIRDITERKQAEEALRESEEQFRTLAEAIPQLCWMARGDGYVFWYNQRWYTYTGTTPEQMKGWGWQSVHDPRTLPSVLERWKAAISTGEPSGMVFPLRGADGVFRPFLTRVMPIKDAEGRVVRWFGTDTDITELRDAQEALRASEERLRLAQQAARIGTFEWNIQTGMNTWTPELEEMYGLPPGGFGGTQAAFEYLVHPDDRAGVIALDDWALKTGQPTKGEWRVVWPDGSVHWIAGRWQVYMNEFGQPARMVGVNIDITDHKLAEEQLARANERLHLALESGSAGGWDYDLKTGKNVWFGKAHAQLGMTPDETSGSRKEFWDRVHEGDRERVEHALQVAKEKREDFAEDVRVVWQDGTIHWLRSRGRFQYAANGEAERSLGISLDITDRKMAEDKLREYERAVEGSGEMIAAVDREYRYLIANNQFLKMRNMTREQVVGRFAHEVLNKGFFEAIAKPRLDECFQGRVVRYETKYSYPEIGERDIFVSYFPIEGANGIDRVACILQDITDQKRAEETLAGMTRKLIDSQEQERVRIARELHDDINQRIVLVTIELEQLQQSPSEVESRVQELRKSLVELSNDLQALSHDLHSSKLEYLGVVAGMKSWCTEFAARQKMEIDFKSDVPSAPPLDVGLSLFRVLQEALHNSAKHSGVRRVEVRLHKGSNEIHLTISDLGKGFEVEAALQGSGLGLTSMRERVRLVNGTFSIQSKPMSGTTIHVRVPLLSETRSQRKAV
jgi:PAS domain S-box-containing protein